jgi:glycosyltransferase involved in cell wall biosynthesis
VGYVVKDGTTGLLSPKSDPVAFAEQLCRMLESRSDASAMAAAGQRDVTQRFSSERLVGDISDLYDELVAS